MQKEIEQTNLIRVLNFFLEQGTITRKDIVNSLDLTVPTVGKMIDMLAEKKIIKEAGLSSSTGGRRPKEYSFNPDCYYVLALAIKVKHLEITLINLKGEILLNKIIKQEYEEKETILGDFKNKISNFLKDNKISAEKILGLGISFPGIVDNAQADCIFSTIVNMKNIPLKQNLEKEFSFPVWVERDVNLMTIGEYHFNHINSQKGVLCVFWETGIGSAFIYQGKIKNSFAGQLGHVIVEPKGKLCFCGKKGCLETVLSEKALVNKLVNEFKLKNDLSLTEILEEESENENIREFILEYIEKSLGIALINYVELYDPDYIIFNGEKFEEITFLTENLKEYILSRIMFNNLRSLNINTSKLGKKAENLGLFTLLKEKEYEKKIRDLFNYS